MPTDKMILYGVVVLAIFAPLGSLGQTCGGTLNKDSPTRNITSPNYPDRLGNGVTCEWIIEAPMGQVQLQFGVFNLPSALFGCVDSSPYVSIYDGSTTSDPSLGQYCGNENGIYMPPDVIMSSSGSLLVHFYSGAYGALLAGQGFVTMFSFPDDVDHCASSPCTNGGTCVDRSTGFLCLCTPEYVGTQCQVSKSLCLLPLGMTNGDIEDNQISASSEKSGYEAYKGRLNGPRAWQPNVANTNQWLQVKFNNRTIITGIQTQGLWGGHVKSYRLLYGDTEDGLSVYTDSGSDGSKIFDANSDGSAVVSHNLSMPIIASIVRVNPQDFTNNLIRLRIELLGCQESAPPVPTQPATTTPSTTTVQSTTVPTTQEITTVDVSTVPETTNAPTTPDRSTTQPTVATTSATIETTLLPSTQSRTTEMPTTSLSQTTTDSTTVDVPSTPLAMSTTPVVETTEPTTTTVPTPTTAATTATSTTPMVETSGTTAVTTTTIDATTATSTTPIVETSGSAATPTPTTAATTATSKTPMVETTETTTAPTSTATTVSSTTPMVETTTVTLPTPTTVATAATLTTPMVEETTTIPTPTSAATAAASTTPVAETTETAKTKTPTPVVTTQMAETSTKVTTMKAPLHTTTAEASTPMKTNPPLPAKTTKPELEKTTESPPKYTTVAKDGDQAEQSGDGGGGGNTAVFAAAGAAGGVAVLVGVGVTVFICRRRGRNSEACGVPMERLAEGNKDSKTDNTSVEVAIGNPLYGAMEEPADKLGIAVNDSCA